ncbi:MAG: hypothetical protein GEU88_17215 [Solirubrobacterales bacterium]|nr:hypothetical protein [Solirubrobacterales bacterium]
MNGRGLIAAALGLAAALLVTYLALGGGDYEPTPVADPCVPREWRSPEGVEEAAAQFSLSALDGAACELHVSRETLALALATPEARQRFAAAYGIDDARLEAAVRAGLVRGIDDAERAGALSPVVAGGLRAIAASIPVEQAIALIEDASAIFDDADGLLGDLGGLLGSAGDLLP